MAPITPRTPPKKTMRVGKKRKRVQPSSIIRGEEDRKPCTCKKTNCLKLYCVCFKEGKSCIPGKCKCDSLKCKNTKESDKKPLPKYCMCRQRSDGLYSGRCSGKYCICKKLGRICDPKMCGCDESCCQNKK